MSPVVGSPPWTSEEDERLRALTISGKPVAEIAKHQGRQFGTEFISLVGERRGRPEKTTSESSFLSNKEMGISDNQSSRWQKLAAMEEGDFERQVAAPPAALSASLGSPLVRVGFAGCHVPVDPGYRMGLSQCGDISVSSRRDCDEVIQLRFTSIPPH